ncbi:MAG: eukaryotic-like serine/threonine-protein kinase, partial [Solirubrobacteraceae bacterium]|nr:eukaryotic-like serine/threonine-protein kinase [Solirubrobacteraceae bacterium]
ESLAYAIEITRALGAAHQRGIVHRDIKPQNVLIDEEGMAKVTDFGIARSLEEDGLTADGRVLGTTDYVSPEQALGHAVNGQSDVYSLGIVLYEMLTGDVPFHGENQVAVAMKHVREDVPDVLRLRPEVSASVAAVLDRMTHKQLDRRTPDSVTLEYELEEALAIEAARQGRVTGEATAVIRALPASTRRRLPFRMRSRNALAAFVLGVLAVAAVAALILIQGADRIQSGTGAPQAKPPSGTRSVSVKRSSAKDYDPFGDNEEHSSFAGRAVDNDPDTVWTTENYSDHAFVGSAGPKPGVGLYVDATPSVDATQIRIETPDPGWDATIYAAPKGDPPDSLDGWTKVGGGTVASAKQTFKLNTNGMQYRYYLVWITTLPPDSDQVSIGGVTLFQDV